MEEAISKAQYRLKLNLFYFLASKVHLVFLILCYCFTEDSIGFLLIYPIGMLLLYRFAFSITRMENPYKIFLFAHWSRFMKKLRKEDA